MLDIYVADVAFLFVMILETYFFAQNPKTLSLNRFSFIYNCFVYNYQLGTLGKRGSKRDTNPKPYERVTTNQS